MSVPGRIEEFAQIAEAVGAEFAPDPRSAVWEVAVEPRGVGVAVSGATSEPAAVDTLIRRLTAHLPGVAIEDGVARLPDSAESTHALVRVSVAPLIALPLISAPQISQVVLGSTLAVLRRWERWLHCRSADGYLGWVHRGYVHQVTRDAARAWEAGDGGEPAVAVDAELRGADGRTVARLPWGARFTCGPDGRARLPDGRAGRLHGDAIAAAERPRRFPTDGEAMVRSALEWLASPYLWGGVTRGGVDCSGLAQTVLRMHGVSLPRDSDQQARCGEAVDPAADFAALWAGDLLFFAEEGTRVTHVALSMGGPRIVHSSLGNGGVACNNLTGDLAYERELRALFVAARRVLPG